MCGMSSDVTLAPTGVAGLRPLSIGELFDRAFAVYVRYGLTFTALLFVVIVPIALVQYFMTRDILDAYMGIVDAAIKHSSTPPDLSKLAEASASMSSWTGVYYLLVFLALPLANAAVVSGVSRAYLGLPVRFRQCYQDAFRRWGYVLLLTLLWLAPLAVLLFVMFFFVLIIGVAIGLLSSLKTFGIIVAAIIGIAFLLAAVGILVAGYMAFAASFIACVLEKADPVRAFVLGFQRIFGGGLFWRSMLVALSILVIGLGFAIVGSVFGGLVFWFTKSPFLYIAVAQFFNVLYVAFAFVLVALYYYDIRIRREGFDIQALADQLSSSSAT
jgi:hypothetical protein